MDEYIKREVLLEDIQAAVENGGMDGMVAGALKRYVTRVPAADVAPVVHGRWIPYLDGDSIMPDRYYRCSECCDRGWSRKWPYCPRCGAKMDGGDGNSAICSKTT